MPNVAAKAGQAEEKPAKRAPRFDFSSLENPVSVQTARRWAAEAGQRSVVKLPLESVIEDPDQPRTKFNEDALQNLAKSIKARGVMQAILVREPRVDGKHVIIHGARRYRGSKIAGKSDIPAVIIPEAEQATYDDYSQVIENIQRENLDAEDMYRFIAKHLAMGEKKGEIAERLGISPRAVSAHLAIKDAPENVLALFRAGKIEGIDPLYELMRLREKSPEVAERLISEAEQTAFGEITRAKIRSAANKANDSSEAEPLRNAGQTPPGESQTESTQSSSSAGSNGSTVGEGPASESAVTGNDGASPSVDSSTATHPLTHEQTKDAQSIRSQEEEGEREKDDDSTDPIPGSAQTATTNLPYHNPASHKQGNGDGRQPDPDHIKKPLLLGEIDGEPVKILLTRRPTTPGLVHISREDTGIEEEVALDRIKLTLLSDMKVQETA
jgi:ParB family chromosome partitioning protein